MTRGEHFRIHTKNPDICLDIYKGHFATSHSHTNYYFDVASNKANLREARAIAAELAEHYKYTTEIHTILCLDGSEVIGACFAEALRASDRFSVNAGNDIYVVTPEHTSGSQLFFRDNTAPMITDKNVLVLAASVVTGYTAEAAVEAVRYYGGTPVGIASIFATITECTEIPVHSVFNPNDLDGYMTSPAIRCPLCKQGQKITALVNSFGCSAL